MPFALNEFARLRPYLYHLTALANLPHLRAARRLHPAADLLRAAGREPHARVKRDAMLAIAVGDHTAILRDQIPLHAGNVALAGGWTFDDLLADLNRRAFFWPGTVAGPIDYGRRHFQRYAAPGQPHESVALRVPTADLLAANPDLPPEFCAYNSGSPRFSGGRPSPRGPETFLPAPRFPGSAATVVEATFPGPVTLPASTELLPLDADTVAANRLAGTWSPLFSPST